MTRITAEFLNEPGLRLIISAFEAAGHRVLVVGGAVRNALLNEPVSDIDLATDARPDQVIDLAQSAGLRTVPTGISHGTVTVLAPNGDEWRGYEVTTFRRDIETDGRHATVAFSDNILNDARRRDFTINALYATGGGEVLDPVGGLMDIAARRLRFVGDARARITEDYLRILRFFRFHAWYGTPGGADRDALAACAELASGLARLSKERIGAEIRKLLSAPDPSDALVLMQGCGVLQAALPGASADLLPGLVQIERRHPFDAAAPNPDWVLRLAALGADDPRTALRLSNEVAAEIRDLIAARDWSLERTAYKSGKRTAGRLALLRLARGQDLPSDWTGIICRAPTSQFPLSASDLMPAITGPALGIALKAAEDHWIDGGFAATRDELRRIAQVAAQHARQAKQNGRMQKG